MPAPSGHTHSHADQPDDSDDDGGGGGAGGAVPPLPLPHQHWLHAGCGDAGTERKDVDLKAGRFYADVQVYLHVETDVSGADRLYPPSAALDTDIHVRPDALLRPFELPRGRYALLTMGSSSSTSTGTDRSTRCAMPTAIRTTSACRALLLPYKHLRVADEHREP